VIPRRWYARALCSVVVLIVFATAALAQAEITQQGHLWVSFDGELTPHALPRTALVPVRAAIGAKIATTDGQDPPQLQRISIAINRNGHFDPVGLPLCGLAEIKTATNASALASCRSSLVGEGHFSANVRFSNQAPFPSEGKVYAFNSRLHGRPAILAHVYGTKPVSNSYVLPFVLKPAKGTYGAILSATVPQAIGDSGSITGLQLSLGRNFTYRGKRRSYLSGVCPAPKGVYVASFPFARARFTFEETTLTSTLTRSCRVKR
jgi:hypothetical protein